MDSTNVTFVRVHAFFFVENTSFEDFIFSSWNYLIF